MSQSDKPITRTELKQAMHDMENDLTIKGFHNSMEGIIYAAIPTGVEFNPDGSKELTYDKETCIAVERLRDRLKEYIDSTYERYVNGYKEFMKSQEESF